MPDPALSADAEMLLNVILEEFRKRMLPEWDELQWRVGARELIDAGLAKIYDHGDRLSFEMTPEAWAAADDLVSSQEKEAGGQ